MKKNIISTFFIFFILFFSFQIRANDLYSEYASILNTFVQDGKVDYSSLKKDRKKLDIAINKMAEISQSNFEKWNSHEQLAFLINLYNAVTLQLIIDHYPINSIKDIGSIFKGPWSQKIVPLFGKMISLDNLEHDIIRKKYDEPRIHMVLVCAAKGCPSLRSTVYQALELEKQLSEQSSLYLKSSKGLRLDENAKRVYLSSIFKWYGDDFPSVRDFVEKYGKVSLKDYAIRWIDYDWSLNNK